MAPSRSRRRGLAAAVAVALSLPLAGCASGFNPQTNIVKPDNPFAQIGALKIQNAAVVLAGIPAPEGQEPGEGAPTATHGPATGPGPAGPGATPEENAEQGEAKPRPSQSPESPAPAADTAALTMAITNTGDSPDTLSAVRVEQGGTATITDGAITIPNGVQVRVGQPGQPGVTLTGLRDVRPGALLTVTLSFQGAGDVRMTLPVYAPTGVYATITPAPTEGAAKPGATPTPGQPAGGKTPASGVQTPRTPAPGQPGQRGAAQPDQQPAAQQPGTRSGAGQQPNAERQPSARPEASKPAAHG